MNKNTKIKMPKLKSEDDTEIVAFSREELSALDEYFRGTNAETAYLLGRYCGLRINECFGLKWDNVDIEAGTITIDRQMQYQDGLIKLVAPKTHNSKRTLYMCAALKEHFTRLAAQRQEYEAEFAALREQNQRMIEDIDGKKISSTELVNCLFDGKIQTVNSMKYPTREIKSKLGIEFKYHYLRHPYVKPKTKKFAYFSQFSFRLRNCSLSSLSAAAKNACSFSFSSGNRHPKVLPPILQ